MILNGDYEIVPVDTLRLHPRNVNQGDTGAIYESIQANGFYGALVVNKPTREVLAGNHRLMAARDSGIEELPVIWVDLSDEDALRILLADNRTARLGADNPALLAELLTELAESDGGLTGTGYDGDALDDLLASLANPELPKLTDESATSSSGNFLRFAKYDVPLTPPELAFLTSKCEMHVEENGTLYGFVGSVLMGECGFEAD